MKLNPHAQRILVRRKMDEKTGGDIIIPETSKKVSLRGDVIAIGDGTNDISILSSAGLAVAMGNAPAEVKAVADYVTLDVERGGIAAAIKKFLL